MRWCALVLLSLVCVSAWGSSDEDTSRLRTLVSWMCGSFSSAAQAQQDSSYLDIRLKMCRIWPERAEEYWLYVEQATAWSQDKPYRQRIYRVTHVGADIFQSEVFELADALRFAGAWRDPSVLATLTPDSLDAREGCAIILRQRNDVFVGSTLGRLCESSLRGAAFATSEVEVGETRLTSWDRGFSSDGAQVWGATEGPYLFDKIESFPLE